MVHERMLALFLTVSCLAGGCGDDGDRGGCPTCPTPPSARTLPIGPILQQTPVWCWASAAEMVFRYYGLPNLNQFGNYQCGIVAAWFGSTNPACLANCGLCQFAVGPMSNEHLVITGYGDFARSLGIPSRDLSASLIFAPLDASQIRTEIDAGRPIVVGISPGGGFALPNASEHIAVIVGYDDSGPRQQIVINDPFPFELSPFGAFAHPYLSRGAVRIRSGQYKMDSSTFRTQLQWANTIYRIG